MPTLVPRLCNTEEQVTRKERLLVRLLGLQEPCDCQPQWS